jgi:hypothetical protein
MTPADILARREALGLAPSQAARLVGVDGRTWRRWEIGTQPMPYSVAVVVRALVEVPGFWAWLSPLAPADARAQEPRQRLPPEYD